MNSASTMSDEQNVLTPIKLDAFVLNDPVCEGGPLEAKIAPITQSNYTFLRLDTSLPPVVDNFYYGQDAMTETPMYATAVQASYSVIDWNSKADADILPPYYIDPLADTVRGTSLAPERYEGLANGQVAVFGAIVGSFSAVHAYSGILPVKQLTLPDWTWQGPIEKISGFSMRALC
ncbi:hypothetical protein BJ166DRAFT_574156 [Pestalotiopsis sp. NC0098]|nr:hypothetical protein BJ166DRAFT_574156 [Pestalotiopsis sp. NC0098]